MTAKAGLKQLESWPKIKRLRRETVELIEELFRKAGLPLWPRPADADVTMLRYPLLTPCKAEILNQARRCGLDISGWYISPIHPLQGIDLIRVDYHLGSCQMAEHMINELVHLPTALDLNRSRLETMVKIISRS
jgi:dTDP-4-amino-4,6-dideoxygalactose transaminase